MPISIRYFKEIHKELLQGVRGKTKSPGELRRSQYRSVPNGYSLYNATFFDFVSLGEALNVSKPTEGKIIDVFENEKLFHRLVINNDILLINLINI